MLTDCSSVTRRRRGSAEYAGRDTDGTVVRLRGEHDDFADAGLALVQLLPVGDAGVQGFALIERIALQRELDITPTRVRVLLFAPPVTTT